MEQILKLPIEIRKKKIHNLYEAIQLFHVFDFKGIFDNVVPRIQIGYLILSVTDMSA